jgi:Holliday junction resolvase RusA-like endonuclease
VIPWEPWSKLRPRISKAVPGKSPRTHQPKEDRDAEDRTRGFLESAWSGPPLDGNVRLSVFFFRSSRQTVDMDNLLKHLQDAATGVLWVNDCQITAYGPTELHLDREEPRTHLWVGTHDEASLVRQYDPLTGKVRT